MIQNLIKKVFGSRSDREMKPLLPLVDEVNQFAESLTSKSDDELRERTQELKASIREIRIIAEEKAAKEINDKDEAHKFILLAEHDKLEEILPEAFAMVKETCRRMCGTSWKVVGRELSWEMVPFDVQIMGGIILHRGNVTEMKTGEGKTLVAAFPIYLNALTGRGVHLITVNDYLAQRDAEWMGEVYKRLGLSVGFILNNMTPEQRRENYNRDITYGTNNEFGFDYLRDNMSLQKEDQVQRDHAYAIVDEVDSVLIDEARTPLIISGAVDAPVDTSFKDLRPLVQDLVRQQNALVSKIVSEGEALLKEEKDRDAGYKLLQALRGQPKHPKVMKIFQEGGTKKLAHQVESEFMRDKKLHEVDDDLFFSIDEKTHVIDITEKGRNALAPDSPETFVIPDLGEMLHDIDENESLSKLEKDQEKENAHQLHADRSGRIHNMTQLLRAYTLYDKDVEYVVQNGRVQIVDEFTGRILAGRRYSDGLHQALEAKENVTVERETQTLATITIQNYFRMYDKLAGMTGTAETEAEEFGSIYNLNVVVIPTNRPIIRDDNEDLIYKTTREKYNAVVEEIASCHHKGQPSLVGTITVEASELLSRLLKRRGIPHNVLNAKQHQSEAEIVARAGQTGAVTIATNMAGRGTDIKLGEGVIEAGGLHIIGTERHESRRIDLQLRGRSGRQGDPGSSVFYLSLEDDLMRLFNSERIASIMDRLGAEEGEVITAKMVTRAIENAQKKVEQRNFGIRKHLLEYDDVMNQQRQVVYDIRNQALNDEDISDAVLDMVDEYVDDELNRMEDTGPQNWDWENLRQNLSSHLLVDVDYESVKESAESDEVSIEDARNFILDQAKEVYQTRESLLPDDVMRGFEKFVMLRTIDEKWKDHLYAMDQLREGINLRAYGQKNPLLEYKSEGFQMFQQMMVDTTEETVQRLYRTQIRGMEAAPEMPVSRARNVQTQHDETTGMGFSGPSMQEQAAASSGVPKQPVHADEKIGRNEKVKMVSPSGKQVEVKYKKLQQYLNQGYAQV
ncbi:MAG TPA: preprotein translocase subunit SecA [Candidatus Marinimicrobia bacterium]|nr:preprotein translocase subunit SecA [Candidatus Neomarinimicrobiota bacterium]